MNAWIKTLLTVTIAWMPTVVFGGDDGRSDDAKNAEATKPAEKISPIQRLAELRIDEFVVPARMINLPLPGKTRTVQDILKRFDEWADDDKIGGVLLDLGNAALSLPDVEELRGGIAKLRKADKKVVAFLNGGGPQAYLLSCAADEIAIAPTGAVSIPGLGAVFPFLKGYYQMVGVEFDVITAGKYKYPGFINQREPNKFFEEEYNAILNSWFGDYKAMIAKSRGMSTKEVAKVIDIALFNADQALERGLVDKIAYYDDYRDQLLRREKMKRYRGADRSLAHVNSIQDLMELVNDELKKAEESRESVGPKIAVLHARGPIVDISLGAGFSSRIICRDDMVKVVNELRKNKSIKAVVMRVDSPGGSGYASDIIWRALRRLAETKPLVVSMGSVAGSGGYYIACPAARIFAQPTTITGSIGVLGIFQSAWSLYNRMDYELVPMQRGARALLGSPNRNMSKKDRAFVQKYINDFYDVFVERVARARKIPADQVKKIAGGRIYTGRQALKIGLVDELGGLEQAIESARSLANIPPSAELKIVNYPRASSLGELFESFSSVGVSTVLEKVSKGLNASQPVGFDQQLRIFSAGPPVLCWMATPDFYSPSALSTWSVGLGSSSANLLGILGQSAGDAAAGVAIPTGR